MFDGWVPSEPDGVEEPLFVPLEAEDPALADRLKRRFVELWLREGRLPLHRFDEALETVELKIAPDEAPRRWRLRERGSPLRPDSLGRASLGHAASRLPRSRHRDG